MSDYDDFDDYEPKGARHTFTPTGFLMVLIAGMIALAVFDAFGQYYSGVFGYSKLAPVPLATQTVRVVSELFGLGLAESAREYGEILHYIAGIVAYPLGYVWVARPIARAILPQLPWWIVAAVYGVVLWVFALYVIAHLVAGNPPFLGFGKLTWIALYGHVIYGIALGACLRNGLRA